jgi:predicted nucleic acid-binding protein
MAAKVVDASAVAAILFAEPEGEAVAARIDGDRLFAPALLPFEIATVCIKKMRRHPSLRQPILARLSLLSRFPIETRDIDCDSVVRLADETMLSAYDASYLWLARTLGAELVTLDRRLAEIAKA